MALVEIGTHEKADEEGVVLCFSMCWVEVRKQKMTKSQREKERLRRKKCKRWGLREMWRDEYYLHHYHCDFPAIKMGEAPNYDAEFEEVQEFLSHGNTISGMDEDHALCYESMNPVSERVLEELTSGYYGMKTSGERKGNLLPYCLEDFGFSAGRSGVTIPTLNKSGRIALKENLQKESLEAHRLHEKVGEEPNWTGFDCEED